MDYVILIIVGIAGIIMGSYFGRRRRLEKPFDKAQGEQNKNEERMENKKENLEKVRRIFDGQGRVANDDVEKLLGVSDVHPAN